MVWVIHVLLDGHGQLGVCILLWIAGIPWCGLFWAAFTDNPLGMEGMYPGVYKCGVDIAIRSHVDGLCRRWHFQVVIYWPLNHGRCLTG